MSNTYTKVGWENGVTPMNATNLNKMDTGIYDAFEAIDNIASTLLNIFYPVGSYYETSDTTFNPGTSWGGTWVLENPGIVHVSAGGSYSVSGAAGDSGKGTKDGGDATVTLNVNQMPSHAHSIGSGRSLINANGAGTPCKAQAGSMGFAFQTEIADYTGGNAPHNNMQPYINVNRWHRTA